MLQHHHGGRGNQVIPPAPRPSAAVFQYRPGNAGAGSAAQRRPRPVFRAGEACRLAYRRKTVSAIMLLLAFSSAISRSCGRGGCLLPSVPGFVNLDWRTLMFRRVFCLVLTHLSNCRRMASSILWQKANGGSSRTLWRYTSIKRFRSLCFPHPVH